MSAQLGVGADLGRTIWGMPGLGAFGFQLQEAPDDRRIVTTTRSHSNKVVTDCVEAMEPHEVVRVGGAGNKVGWIFCVHSVQPWKCSPTYQNDLCRSSSSWKDELLLTSLPVWAVRSGTPVLLRPSWPLWEVQNLSHWSWIVNILFLEWIVLFLSCR